MGESKKSKLAQISLKRHVVVRCSRPVVPPPPVEDGRDKWMHLYCRTCGREVRVRASDMMSMFGTAEAVIGCPFCDALGGGFQPLGSFNPVKQ
jgi:hypothetical protein